VPPGSNTPPPGPTSKLESNWQPAEARTPATTDNRVLLGPPETPPPPGGNAQATPLPVGIAQFTPIRANIATGRRPQDDGWDWLHTSKYRTVLHLRLPGENDDADRRHAEKRGLAYKSLEVSPLLLTKDTVEEFVKLARDPAQQPLFVYDRDGALTGGLWYIFFRTVDQDGEDIARIRARAAGLREDREGACREMWQTVQKYLGDMAR
jgi:protein tyrosine phosphatase (PTP) superfamily phosphohydrolase (DUF442 family)